MAALVFAWILGIRPGNRRFWWVGAIILLAQFSISALNEWQDAALDARTGRRRPIPLGLVPRSTVLVIALVLGGATILLGMISGFGTLSMILVIAGLACGYIYDLWLKGTPFSFLPFTVAFPLMVLWVGFAAQIPPAALLPVVLGGVPLAAAIHLADAIPDREADRGAGVNTLAVSLGRPGAEMTAAALLLIGTLVAMAGVVGRGSLPAFSGIGIALTYVVANLASRPEAGRWMPLGKWMLIAGAFFAAVVLVLLASGRH